MPQHDTTYGILVYLGREYRLLNNPLSKELIEKYKQLSEEMKQPYCSAPWLNQQTKWEIRDHVLYLTEMFREDLLMLLIGLDEQKATWVDMLSVYIATEIPLDRDGYCHTKETVHFLELGFNNARHIATQKKEGKGFFDQSRRMVNYLGRQEGLYRFDRALLSFVKGGISLNAHGTIAEYMTNDLKVIKHSICLERMLRDVDQVLYLCKTIALYPSSDMAVIANRIVSTLSIISQGNTTKYCIFCNAEEGVSKDIQEQMLKAIKKVWDSHEDNYFDLVSTGIQNIKAPESKRDRYEDAPRVIIQIFVGL